MNGDNDSATALLHEKQARARNSLRDITFAEYMTVGILCFVNLINYMDRFTLAGKTFISYFQHRFLLEQYVMVRKSVSYSVSQSVSYGTWNALFIEIGTQYEQRKQ